MARRRGIEWSASADKHGYSFEDVLYAARHIIRKRTYDRKGETYVKFTGLRHGDPLVRSIEVIMKLTGSGEIVVFHVNAEQDRFWDHD